MPKIGNDVFIGPGAVIFGPVEIADGIAIGANSFVNKSFEEPNITIAGSPARKVSNKGSEGLHIRATEILRNQQKAEEAVSSEVTRRERLMGKTTVKILIISYFFPPCTDGAATLMHNVCKYLPQDSYSVITAGNELGVRCWNGLGAFDREFALCCKTFRLPVQSNELRDRIKFLVLAALKGIVLKKKEGFNCVLAVYPDDFDLFVGYFLRKLTRKPLIVYMHDLYSETRKTARLAGFYRRAEKKVFSSASAILVTNEKFKEYYLGKGTRNVIVLNSGVELRHINDTVLPPTRRFPDTKLKVVFTGSIYGTNEDAILCFLQATKRLKDVEVAFCSPSKPDYLKEVSIGFLPKKECFMLQRSSDILFLPLSITHPYQEEIRCAFPLKTLEYLAAGKPILAVVPEGSFVKEFIERYKVGIVISELSEQKIANAIEELKDEKKRRYYTENALKTSFLFDAANQSKKLYSIIESIVNGQPIREEPK
jgi:serine O-acetyltransferase